MAKLYSASQWVEWMKFGMRFFPLRGLNSDISYTGRGIVISADESLFWRHPWSLRFEWEPLSDDKGQWKTYVWPGFVNGRDAHIQGIDPETEKPIQVPLTADDPAGLVLSWRNPLASQGISASEDGELVYGAGEGYPDFFRTLGGVRDPAPGGDSSDVPPDPKKTREIRACDLVLSAPRTGVASEITLRDPSADGQVIEIGTKFLPPARDKYPYRLRITPKFTPVNEPTNLERMLGTAVEPTFDEIKIATIWTVSPPNPMSDIPDETWEMYPQHAVFWNLAKASRELVPANIIPSQPLRIVTGLVAGVADGLFQQLLSPINDAYSQMNAYFNSIDFKGKWWSV